MSKHDQTHFLDKLRRTVQPSPQRAEPLVWFREVRILTELSQKEGVERRKIVLHRGLNILWAAPEDPGHGTRTLSRRFGRSRQR